MKALRYFRPGVNVVALAILAVGALLGVWGLAKAHARIAIEQEIRAACDRELREIERASPFVVTYFRPADPCIALRVVRGGR